MKNNFFIFSLLKLLLLLILLFESCLNYCNNREEPIYLTSDELCTMKYCSEQEFEDNICVKSNTIIKTQWLNNIIKFGEENGRFTKIAKYSNGDLVAFSALQPGSTERYFYGLKNNGRPLFTDNGQETPFMILNIEYENNQYFDRISKYNEGEILSIKTAENKEYIINVEKGYIYTELYDFQNKFIHKKQTHRIFSNQLIVGVRTPLFNLKDSNYFIYGGLIVTENNYDIYNTDTQKKLCLFKLIVNNIETGDISVETIENQLIGGGNIVSAFETTAKKIVLFYMETSTGSIYKIICYKKDSFSSNYSFFFTSITSNIINGNLFLKCLHYDKETGIFIYYKKIESEGPFPIITFQEMKNDKIEKTNNVEDIALNQYIFDNSYFLNDIILVSKELMVFSSVSINKDILYIVKIDIFTDDNNQIKFKIRYYVIRSFGLYNYKFYMDLKLNTFKESIVLASSYCEQETCVYSDTSNNIHFSSLIFFSYPNSQDRNDNIVEEIFEQNNLPFILNLSKYVSIDNNIFGLIYSKIIIENIDNCNTIKLISSITNLEISSSYYELKNDEFINITFENYDFFNCTIAYFYEATEPDYETYENYPEKIDVTYGNYSEEYFYNKTKKYPGKLSYYNLYLNDTLTDECDDNCILCYDNSEKNCIVCKYNYSIETETDINGIKGKVCLNQENKETEKVTEMQTELLTEKYTELPTESGTEASTESPTEIPTEAPTEVPTETISEKSSDEITNAITNEITDEMTEKSTEKPTVNPTDKSTEKIECSNDEIITSHCSNGKVKSDQFSDLNKQIEEKFLNEYKIDGEKKIIVTENVIFQIEKYDEQSEEDNYSSVYLGKCETALKIANKIDLDESLIIYKTDIKSDDLSTTYVQYKIYHPDTLEPLDCSTVCSKDKISISVPVNLDDNTKSLIKNANNGGYDLFNSNDSFYNDICATYTTENGTDMGLNDRKNAIKETGGNLNYCQVGCQMDYFNYTNQKVKCNCDVVETKNVTNFDDIEFTELILLNLVEGLKTSNYLVMKCFQLLLDFDLLKKNIGFIFMMIIFILFLIFFCVFLIKGRNKIDYYIQAVLKNKYNYINNRKSLKNHGKNDSSLKLGLNLGSKEQLKIKKNEKCQRKINKDKTDKKPNKEKEKKKKNNSPIKNNNNENKSNKNNDNNKIKNKNMRNSQYNNNPIRNTSSIKYLVKSKDNINKNESSNLNNTILI